MQNGVDLSNLATEEPAADQNEAIDVTTAFTLAMSPEGGWVVLSDPSSLRLQRAPSMDDMYAGCAVVQKDIAAQLAAMHTQRAMVQLTQAMQQQQQAQSIASKLKL